MKVTTTPTAKLTNASGDTSRFGILGLSTGDTDDDGVRDDIEGLAGTDPNNQLDTPDLAGATTVRKMSIKLNFSGAGKDSIKLTTSVVLPAGFVSAGSRVGVAVGGYSEHLILDADGKASTADSSVVLKTSIKLGPILTYGIKNASLQAALAASGLSDKTTADGGERWVIPVAVTLGSSVSYGTVTVSYKAKQGKAGSAR